MSDSSSNNPINVSLVRRIDAVCDRFESAWKGSERPRIEDYLADWQGEDRLALAGELVQLDAYYRAQAGEKPRLEDYQERFPELDPRSFDETISPSRGIDRRSV